MRVATNLRVRWLCMAMLAASAAVSDEIVLKTGGRLQGKAIRENGQVLVRLESGTVAFPESVVQRIVPGSSPLEIREQARAERSSWLAKRLAQEGVDDAQSLYRVAQDARTRGFPEDELRGVLGLVLGLDPDHGGARTDLGDVPYRGRWVTREEARRLDRRDHAEEMRSRGFVLFRGEWVTQEEIDSRRIEEEWEDLTRDLEEELEAVRSDLSDAKDGESELAGRLYEKESELEEAMNEVSRLETEVERLSAAVHALGGQIQFCQGSLQSCEAELQACRVELSHKPRPICEPE